MGNNKSIAPRHGQPLSQFQEQLYEIVLHSVAKKIIVETDVFQNIDTILNIYQRQHELLLANEEKRIQYASLKSNTYQKESLGVKAIVIMEQMSGPVQENLRSIFLFLIIFILLYLQIMQGWMIKESSKFNQVLIGTLKWIIMTLLGGHLIKRLIKKLRILWHQLTNWVDAPMDCEEV